MPKEKLCEIVEYSEEYFDYLYSIHKENFMKCFVSNYGTWYDNRMRKSFCNMLSSGNYKMIKYKGKVIGLINYKQGMSREKAIQVCNDEVINEGDYSACLRYLNIDKRYQRLGIGSYILESIVEDCYNEKCSAYLKVYKDNDGAIKLYKRYGFKIDEKENERALFTMRLCIDDKPETNSLDDDETLKSI